MAMVMARCRSLWAISAGPFSTTTDATEPAKVTGKEVERAAALARRGGDLEARLARALFAAARPRSG